MHFYISYSFFSLKSICDNHNNISFFVSEVSKTCVHSSNLQFMRQPSLSHLHVSPTIGIIHMMLLQELLLATFLLFQFLSIMQTYSEDLGHSVTLTINHNSNMNKKYSKFFNTVFVLLFFNNIAFYLLAITKSTQLKEMLVIWNTISSR